MAALLLSTLAALSAVYWGLHWRLPAQQAMAGVAEPAEQALDVGAVARGLGAAPEGAAQPAVVAAPAAEASRFVLQGVLGGDRAGAALIAIDNKPAKPFALGAELASGWQLTRVSGRTVTIVRQGAELELSLPPLALPATAKKAP